VARNANGATATFRTIGFTVTEAPGPSITLTWTPDLPIREGEKLETTLTTEHAPSGFQVRLIVDGWEQGGCPSTPCPITLWG